MTRNPTWQPLRDVLGRLRDAGRTARFWWRDDDAVAVTPALLRLVGLCREADVPLALAVIPARAEPELAGFLVDESRVLPLVHGWAHANHAPPDQKRRELWLDRPAQAVLDELRLARATIEDMFPARSASILVPPWNRIDPALVPHLPELGYAGLSVFGPVREEARVAVINATVDIIDSRGTRGCRPHDVLVAEVVGQLDRALEEEDCPPVGLLTHHLVHDEAAWEFVEKLLSETAEAGNARWEDVETRLEMRGRATAGRGA